MTRRTPGTPSVAAALAMAAVACVVASGCTAGASTAGTASPVPVPSLSGTVSPCSSAPADVLLRMAFRGTETGASVPVAQIFAAPPRFLRWVDETVEADLHEGYIGSSDYSNLARHFRYLHDRGIRLKLTSFKPSTTSSDQAGFTFHVKEGAAAHAGRGVGIYACDLRRITLVKF